MLTDSHCHIDYRTELPDQDDLVARAREAGVTRMVTIGSGSAGDGGVGAVDRARRAAERYEGVWFTAGVHPHDAALWTDETEKVLRKALAHPDCVAIGECGLDFWYDHSPFEPQERALRRQIEIGLETGKPIVIHARDSKAGDRSPEGVGGVLDILEEMDAGRVGGVMHCFGGTAEEATRSVELGFYIAIPGIVTFKKPGALPDVVAEVPDDKLLVETDSPFLAPHPKRGRKNEPAYLVYTAAKVAELRGVDAETLALQTSRNAARLYGLPEPA